MDDNEGRGARLPAEITQESVESCRPSKDRGGWVRECCGQRGLSVKRVTTSGGASLSHISPVTHWKRLCHWLGLQPPPFRADRVHTKPSTTSAVQHPPLRSEMEEAAKGGRR